MWYLIIPPLIFLGSLWLLLVFLSRRLNDPVLAQKLSQRDESVERSLFFIKEEMGLRILEKINQRFKVFFLKLHNASSHLAQSIKARRERFREKRAAVKGSQQNEIPLTVLRPKVIKKSFWMRFRKSDDSEIALGAATSEEQGDNRSLVSTFDSERSNGQGSQRSDLSSDSVQDGQLSSSFISRRRGMDDKPKRLVSEEDLIGKIAKNPKDAVAYEELGDYYMETKQLTDAKACYRQVIKLLPMNRAVKEKVRKLERLLTRTGR